MQTDFAEKIGKPVGLQRGVEGSKAVHTTAKQYAAALQKNPTLAPPSAPAPSVADRITGRARQMEEEHAAAQAKHAALVEQARNVAMVSRHARARQAAALELLRQEVEEAKRLEAEAACLREENRLRKRDLQEQRTYFQRQIADLKAALAKAVDQVKHLLVKVDLLMHQRDRAEGRAPSAIAPQFGAFALETSPDELSMHSSTNRV